MSDEAVAVMRATYYGMSAEVDAQVGRTIAFLKASGRYERTLIVVTSDHGDMLGDHRLLGKCGYFDAAYHVPLIVKPAGGTPAAGWVVDAFTEAVDVAPTILEQIGAAVPPAMDGRSLSPFLAGGVPATWRDAVHWEYDFREIAGTASRSSATLSRSEEHTSELQSLMRISYAVFCLKKKKAQNTRNASTH